MKATSIKKLSLILLVSASCGAFAQQTSPDIAEKSASYIESLRVSDKQKKESVTVKENDKKDASAVKVKESTIKPDTVADNKKPEKKERLAKAPSKPKTVAKSVVSEKDNQAYVVNQQAESLIAVYPELTAIYSKGGVYFVVLRIGSRTITAQDGENTICGVVKVLNLNSARVGNQVLSVN